MRMGKAKVGQVEMDVCMEFLPEANIGNYVRVHVGTALTLINEEDALGIKVPPNAELIRNLMFCA